MPDNIEYMRNKWRHEHGKPASYLRRRSAFIDKEFQLRYTAILVGAAALGMCLVIGPVYYLLNQNYYIFLDLAYESAPDLLKYLEYEKNWLVTLLVAVFCGLMIFTSIVGIRMTIRIIGPLKVMQNHLKMLSRGHWNLRPIKVRESDEFQELIETYNYFYSAFQNQIKRDLERLKSISVDKSNRDAYHAWRSMLEEKSLQLGLDESDKRSTSLSAESGDRFHDSHRAS